MNRKRKKQRWRLLADVRIQGQICIRIAVYWVLCQVSIFATIALFGFLTNGEGSIASPTMPALIVSMLLLPIVIFDMLNFSNKFVGPMVNMRNQLTKLNETGSTEPLQLRDGDYYGEIAELLNELRLMHEKTVTTDVQTTPQEELEFHV